MTFKVIWEKLQKHPLARIGPGLVTGVADDDPSGIVTYSQAGAQFGLGMLWTMPLSYPLMSAIQVVCAQIGRATGKGLAANLKENFHPAIVVGLVLLLLIANVLNIAADIAAMGEVAELVTGINWHLMTVLFVLISWLLLVFVPYHRYVFFLKWLTLSLLAYGAVLLTVHVHWGEVFMGQGLNRFGFVQETRQIAPPDRPRLFPACSSETLRRPGTATWIGCAPNSKRAPPAHLPRPTERCALG